MEDYLHWLRASSQREQRQVSNTRHYMGLVCIARDSSQNKTRLDLIALWGAGPKTWLMAWWGTWWEYILAPHCPHPATVLIPYTPRPPTTEAVSKFSSGSGHPPVVFCCCLLGTSRPLPATMETKYKLAQAHRFHYRAQKRKHLEREEEGLSTASSGACREYPPQRHWRSHHSLITNNK